MATATSDLIVGAPVTNINGTAGGRNAGISYVVFGNTGITSINLSALGTHGFIIDGQTVNDKSGWSVSAAGDVNGDGLADLLVATPYNSSSVGRSYVVFARPTTAPSTFRHHGWHRNRHR